MTDTAILWILGGMNAVTWLLIGWLKTDIKDLWTRANSHGHVINITCDSGECNAEAVTKDVTIHAGGGMR